MSDLKEQVEKLLNVYMNARTLLIEGSKKAPAHLKQEMLIMANVYSTNLQLLYGIYEGKDLETVSRELKIDGEIAQGLNALDPAKKAEEEEEPAEKRLADLFAKVAKPIKE